MSDVEDHTTKEKREEKEELKKSKKLLKELKKELKELKKELKELKKDLKQKKRSADDLEEISIDLAEPAPLSKKQKRLLRQGKLTVEKLLKKNKIPKPLVLPEGSEEESATKVEKKEKSEFGVWIGNLSFDTTKDDLKRFLMGKTNTLPEYQDSMPLEELVKIEDEDITRINLPKNEKKIKGFAYVDFKLINHVYSAISLSEQHLNGRNLLIKNANSFEGRPKKDPVLSLSKNPPSRILFVGNLSFDTSKELLEEHFQSCGEIIKIRMATFEDSGKCKGFAFIDFKDEKGPIAALSNNIYKKLINRPLRLEFGEDRSKRNPTRKFQQDGESSGAGDNGTVTEGSGPVINPTRMTNIARERVSSVTRPSPSTFRSEQPYQLPIRSNTSSSSHNSYNNSNNNNNDMGNNQRLKSSVLLATAQRASVAIVKSTGKKIKF